LLIRKYLNPKTLNRALYELHGFESLNCDHNKNLNRVLAGTYFFTAC